MGIAKSKGTIGQGWHSQSMRHSKARRTGRAGGTYAGDQAHKTKFSKDNYRLQYKDTAHKQKHSKIVIL